MYKLEVCGLKYKYLAGREVIAIITPNRKIKRYPISRVQSNPNLRVLNGTSDCRIAPEEVAAFIVKHKLR